VEEALHYARESPDDADFTFAVTDLLLKGNQSQRAVAFLKPIVMIQPHYRLYVRYAELLHHIGAREDAVKTLQVAATLDHKPVMALYQLGYLLKASGRFGEATVAFEKLLEIQPGYPTIQEALRDMRQQSSLGTSPLSSLSVPAQ
jgi:tetratricopeptide (TPR) repeat protein